MRRYWRIGTGIRILCLFETAIPLRQRFRHHETAIMNDRLAVAQFAEVDVSRQFVVIIKSG